MRISLIIMLSLATNVVLALVWLRVDYVASSRTSDDIVSKSSLIAPDAGQSNAATFEADGVATQSSWTDLQTEDLKEFVRRLRAVGCPEETIKDLVLAQLNRSYSIKQRAIWQNNFNPNDYWKPYKQHYDPAESKKNRERSRQLRDMQKEKTALIVELFGVDVEKQRRKEEGLDYENWVAYGNLAYLPESKRDAVQKYLEDFQDKEQEFYASVQGGWDADARARQKKLEQEKMAGLAQILTPEELREYALHDSQAAMQVQSNLHGVDLTRQQYEALFDIQNKYGDSIYNWSDEGNDPTGLVYKQIEQNQKDMKAEIATTLGADKAQELDRAQDYNYQQLNSLANHYDLPADTAAKVYDFKSAAEKAVQDLSANTDLTPDQQQAAREQIKTETEQAVKTAFGSDKIYKSYMNNGGWWLNNIAPAPPKQN